MQPPTVWVFAAGVWAGQETVPRIGLETSANSVHMRRGTSQGILLLLDF